MKKFAAFDLDGTLIRWQLYHTVANRLARLGYLGNDAAGTIDAARMRWKKREKATSFREYEVLLYETYEAAITNVPIDEFDKAVHDVVYEYKDQVYTYTRELLKRLQGEGYFTMAISGSHQEIVAEIARLYGFDDYEGTIYERNGNMFTGQATSPVDDKSITLRKLVERNGLTYEGSYAIGDSESDIPMLENVQNPIAFNPAAGLFEHARGRGWNVVVERKNMIYELKKFNDNYTLI